MALGAAVQLLGMVGQHPRSGVDQLQMRLDRGQQLDPGPHAGGGADPERGDLAAGGAAGGLGVDGVGAEDAFVEEPFLPEPDADVDERHRHLVRQTFEVVRHLLAVAVPEVDEVEVVDHDQLGLALVDAIHGERAEPGRGGPVRRRMPVEREDLLVQALQRDPGRQRHERHRQPLAARRGLRPEPAVGAAVEVAGVPGRDRGLAQPRARRRSPPSHGAGRRRGGWRPSPGRSHRTPRPAAGSSPSAGSRSTPSGPRRSPPGPRH